MLSLRSSAGTGAPCMSQGAVASSPQAPRSCCPRGTGPGRCCSSRTRLVDRGGTFGTCLTRNRCGCCADRCLECKRRRRLWRRGGRALDRRRRRTTGHGRRRGGTHRGRLSCRVLDRRRRRTTGHGSRGCTTGHGRCWYCFFLGCRLCAGGVLSHSQCARRCCCCLEGRREWTWRPRLLH